MILVLVEIVVPPELRQQILEDVKARLVGGRCPTAFRECGRRHSNDGQVRGALEGTIQNFPETSLGACLNSCANSHLPLLGASVSEERVTMYNDEAKPESLS